MKEKLYSYRQSVLVFAIGLLLSLFFYLFAEAEEQRGLEENFLLQSDIQSQDMDLSFTHLIGKVDAIYGYVRNKLVIEPGTKQKFSNNTHRDAFSPVSFEDFLFLNTSSEDIASWKSYAWFPKVEAYQLPALYNRAKSDSWSNYVVTPNASYPIYPVYYIDTKEPSRYPMGYNISDNLHFRNAILRAPDSSLVIQADSSGNTTIGLLKPVYKDGRPPKSKSLREKNLLGFVFGEWQLDALISPVLEKYQWHDRSITVSDKESGIILWRDRKGSVDSVSFSEKRTLNVAGTELVIEFKAGPEFIANHSTQYALRVFGAGILLTLMLVYFLTLQVNRQKTIEREVVQKTAAYRQTFAKLESLLGNFKGGIVFENQDQRIVLTNNCIYKLLGLDHSISLIDQYRSRWLQCLEGICSDLKPLNTAINEGKAFSGLSLKTDDDRYLELDFIPIFRGGKHEGNIWILCNVTEKELMHQQLEHAQRLEGMGLLAGGIAHDFNNILTSIMGNTALVERKHKQGMNISEYLEHINHASDKAANLCKQMLAYSGRGQFIVQKINIAQQIKEITDFLNVSVPKSVSLELDLDSENLMIEADATQVQQVILNLIKNATDAIEGNNGIVRVSTYREHFKYRSLPHYLPPIPRKGDYLVIEVTDNGCGMSSETQKQIFEPFFTTKQNGHGLGMSAVLGIIRGHDSFITIDSKIGKGTTFQVCFPICDDAASKLPDEKNLLKTVKGMVLLVDDEIDILESTTMILQDHGMEVVTAVNGLDALEKFQQLHDQIDLTILDLSMPKMGGIECLQQMRKVDPDSKVILTSGYHEGEIREKHADLEHTLFLQKPYFPDKLINSIHLNENGSH